MKTTHYLSIFLLALIASSCTEEIPFDLNEQGFDRLVVEGFFTDQEKAHKVRLTKTTSFFNQEQADPVTGAQLTISNALNSWTLTEEPPGSGLYYTPADAAGTPGMNHQLEIVSGGETYMAVDYMNEPVELDSIEAVLVEEFYYGEEDFFWAINAWTQEQAGVSNYYRWRTLINGETDSDTIRFSFFTDDVGIDGAYINGLTFDSFGPDKIQIGDSITLEQHAISEEYYRMISAVFNQTESQGGLFDPPPANVQTNVTNGALGFFSASSVSSKSTIAE